MPLGLLTGLGAALSWGTLDVFSALASRRIGSLRVTTGMQVVGAALIWIAAIATGTRMPSDPAVLVGGALVGLTGAGAYLSYHRQAAPLLQGEAVDGGRADRRVIAAVALAGLLDVTGLLAFAYGLERAETWLVGLASSFGPAVTIVVAVVFLGERLRPIQWLGLTGVLFGMIAIGLP